MRACVRGVVDDWKGGFRGQAERESDDSFSGECGDGDWMHGTRIAERDWQLTSGGCGRPW